MRPALSSPDIRPQTMISTNTLTRLSNDQANLVAISTIDRLCAYFDCQPGDLFIYVPELQQS